jgi:hypothetical protein
MGLTDGLMVAVETDGLMVAVDTVGRKLGVGIVVGDELRLVGLLFGDLIGCLEGNEFVGDWELVGDGEKVMIVSELGVGVAVGDELRLVGSLFGDLIGCLDGNEFVIGYME